MEDIFSDFCPGIPDPRPGRNILYPVSGILFSTPCATVSDRDGWNDIEEHGVQKEEFLKETLIK